METSVKVMAERARKCVWRNLTHFVPGKFYIKYLHSLILKCAIPVVCMNNRYMGAVNNTTSISNDVYRG